ncbi:alpha/beta hydrolase [Taibaiella koreensis]|uniref:alpha/beta hydrolase n=1 Tax=Taibaiella koreensis TaxID=1268548 RepID=UPI000E5A03C7|nr:alpha/beta hydrolase-fold protein [Taibaiella koreensis]
MRLMIAGLSLLLFFPACKKNNIDQSRIKTFDMTSVANGGHYTIRVVLPDHYTAAKKYSTLYMTDAAWDFDDIAAETDRQSTGHGKEGILVVGISWGYDRLDDYTPTPTEMGKGKADLFVRFIRTELIPRIVADFNADTSRAGRIIIGHSAGGLFAGHCFTNHNDLFGHYICLSPAFWWDNAVVLRNEKANREQNRKGTGTFFLGLGGTEEKMRPAFESFKKTLQTYYTGYQQQSNIERQYGHLDSKKANIREGLSFYFTHR